MGTAESAQAQLAEFEDAFKVGEQYLYFLPFPTRLAISLGLADCTRQIARRLVRAAVNFAGYHVGAAPRFKLTWPAVVHAGSIAKWRFRLAVLSRLQIFASRANVTVTFGIEDEIGTAESAVVMLGFIPYRHVRSDPFLIDQPSQHCSNAVVRIAHQALGLDSKLFLDTIDHRFSRLDLSKSTYRRCLDVHNHSRFQIDQVIR